jgi:transposase
MHHHKAKLRHIAPPERAELQAMARSRTLETRLGERVRLILALEGSRNYAETAREQHVTRMTVYNWIERFNTLGLAGLEDQPRSGRPPVYSSDERSEVIAAALTKPQELGLEFLKSTGATVNSLHSPGF